MRRPARPEAVRAVQKVLLVDRFQHHHHRPLKHLVLEGRDPDRARLAPVALRNVHPPHRRRPVRPGLEAVEQRPRGCPPGSPRTPPPSVRPRPPRRPCACADTPRAATRCRCGEPGSVNALSGACLASSAIRCSFVETVSGFDVPVMFPSNGSVTRRPPSLHGVPRVGSPASSVLRERSDFPPPVPPRFVAFAWRYHRVRPSFRSRSGRTPAPAGLEPCSPVALAGSVVSGDDRISQVPGEPSVRMPSFSDPGGTSAPGHCGASVLPSAHAHERRLPR